MKINKTKGSPSNCKTNFERIVNEGKWSGEDIIRATEFHINTVKDLSVKSGKNQLSFIPNSERYLRIKSFGPYVERSKEKKEKEVKTDTFI